MYTIDKHSRGELLADVEAVICDLDIMRAFDNHERQYGVVKPIVVLLAVEV